MIIYTKTILGIKGDCCGNMEVEEFDFCCDEMERAEIQDIINYESTADRTWGLYVSEKYQGKMIMIPHCPFCTKRVEYKNIKTVQLRKVITKSLESNVSYVEEEIC